MNLLDLNLSLPQSLDFYHVEIPGEPRPWKRPVHSRGHVWNASRADQVDFAWQLKCALPKMRSERGSLWGVRMRLYTRTAHKGDLDNRQKNIFDALQRVVWANDSQIRESFAIMLPSKEPRTEMVLYRLSPQYIMEAL